MNSVLLPPTLSLNFDEALGRRVQFCEAAVNSIPRMIRSNSLGPGEQTFDSDSNAFLVSLLVHVAILVSLGLTPKLMFERQSVVTITAPLSELDELTLPEEFQVSDIPMELGANSKSDSGMALSSAPVLSDVSEIRMPVEVMPAEVGKIELNPNVDISRGIQFDNLPIRGAVGEGVTGTAGAVDRLTKEILLSLEERNTLVVWIFDQSPSVFPQRHAILERFDRIYEELGIIEAAGSKVFQRNSDKPLLTAVMCFGKRVSFVTDKPTDNLAEIKESVRDIPEDLTGEEMIFSAIYMAADRFKKYRTERPARNVMIVAFTDEVGDDQEQGLDKTVALCRRNEMPVYIVGAPAPFGQNETLVKWVDPDPRYDQSVQWGTVNQGPESLYSERLKLSFLSGEDRDPIDSGFGPFALTRLAYETGGVYFSVHPNRNVTRKVSRSETATYSAHLEHFFDPVVMRKYRPDYVTMDEFHRRLKENKMRQALLEAARKSGIERLTSPRKQFVKRSEAELAADMSEAQKAAARLEPVIGDLYATLRLGEADRDKEISPRWQAGFDLAMGQVLAVKVRTESYNAMLAAAKRGLKFKDEKNNTWLLEASSEVSVGSQTQKLAERAKMYLDRVVSDHPNTPWALLASQELKEPLSWKWGEKFTDLNPPRNVARNNPTPRPPNNDKAKMPAKPPAPKRELKRL